MNRKSFFRNMLGLIGITLSAKELSTLSANSSVPPVMAGVDMAAPGIEPGVFRIFIHKHWFSKNDIIQVGSTQAKYHIAEEDGHDSYLANLVWAPDGSVVPKQIRLQDFGDPEHMVLEDSYPLTVNLESRLYSALPE